MEIGELVALPAVEVPKKQVKKEPKPTIKARWSKYHVTPNHNTRWPPLSPPTDRVPEEAKVRLLVDTTHVPNGTSATISIHHCHTGAMVKNGTLKNLIVRANRLLDPTTGRPPIWIFESKHTLWDPWDKPFYFFKVKVDYQGLEAETAKDYKSRDAKVLRLVYWHASVSDAIADTPAGGGLTTRAEMREIAGILKRNRHHRVYQRAFNQQNVPVNLWGSVLRNTYAYHHASHGDIVDRATGTQLNAGNENPPTNAVGNWRSVVVLGNTSLGDMEVNQTANVPTVPRYLVYMDTCVAGWEESLGNAFISRGTRNYLAFRMYIPDNDARQMARNFYKKWCITFKCNPEKIPDVFFDVGAPYYGTMRPVLLGAGGGEIQSPLRQAINAIFSAIAGFIKDVASLFK